MSLTREVCWSALKGGECDATCGGQREGRDALIVRVAHSGQPGMRRGRSGWGGWPLGTDITDTKTEVLLLFWLITIVLALPGLKGRKMAIPGGTYSFLVILSFAVTFITFLIPHSL